MPAGVELPRSALVVANGSLPAPGLVRHEIAQVSFVLAADGGANELARIGLVPDAVLGDMDSLVVDLPERTQVIHAPDQNRTDLDKAITYLKDEGFESITIIGATGDRLDHTFGSLAAVVKHGVRLVDNVGYAVSVRGPGQVGFATQIGQIVSLMPMGKVSSVVTRNLKWNLDGVNFNFAERDGTSNVALEEYVEVFVREGDMIVYAHHLHDD